MSQIQKWDYNFLSLARQISFFSKDPSTKVGALIARPDRTIASMGFNGFPKGIKDDWRLSVREEKYKIIIHAEMNAILNAKESVEGYTLYVWPLAPCINCCKHVIQSGIKRIVYPVLINDYTRWTEELNASFELFSEACIETEGVYLNISDKEDLKPWDHLNENI